MKSLLLPTLVFALQVSDAQYLSNPDWTITDNGFAESKFKKIHHNTADESIIALGSFRRGDLELGTTVVAENPLLDNHFIVKINSSGQQEFIINNLTTTADILVDSNGDIVVPSGDTLYKFSGANGSLVWKKGIEPVAGSYIKLYQAEELPNGEIILAGEGYSEDIAAGNLTLDRSYTGYYLLIAICDAFGNFSLIRTIDFNNEPLLGDMTMKTGDDGKVFLGFRADEISNDDLGNGVILDAPVSGNNGRYALAAFNSNVLATWSITFRGDTENTILKEIAVNSSNGALMLSGNQYGINGNTGPFDTEVASVIVNTPCSGVSFHPFSIVIDTLTKSVVFQYETDFSCQSPMQAIAFRELGNGEKYAVYQYHEPVTINGYTFIPGIDTTADQQYLFPSLLVKYDVNGNVTEAKDLDLNSGNYFGDVFIHADGSIVTAGTFSDPAAPVPHTPHAIIKKYTNTPTAMSNINHNGNSVMIYPNPSQGNFSVESEGDEILSVEVYATSGQLILSNPVNSPRTSLDLSRENKGIYLLKTQTRNSIIKRLVVVQ